MPTDEGTFKPKSGDKSDDVPESIKKEKHSYADSKEYKDAQKKTKYSKTKEEKTGSAKEEKTNSTEKEESEDKK